MIESIFCNKHNAIADGNGAKGRAITKGIISYIPYTVGDSDGGKGGTTAESKKSNTRYTIDASAISNSRWNNHFSRVCILITI